MMSDEDKITIQPTPLRKLFGWLGLSCSVAAVQFLKASTSSRVGPTYSQLPVAVPYTLASHTRMLQPCLIVAGIRLSSRIKHFLLTPQP